MGYFCYDFPTAINCNSLNECIPKCTQHSLILLTCSILTLLILTTIFISWRKVK